MWELRFFAAAPVARAEIEAWLAARHHWVVAGDSAVYDNPTTGAHAWLRLGVEGPFPAMYLLPWVRPHTFALESSMEIEALVEHFGLEVRDPTPEGMANGPWDRAGFLRGWGVGSAAAYQALAEAGEPELPQHTLPAAVLTATWRWNYDRLRYQDHVRAAACSCFVPGVFLFATEGEPEVRTGVLWGDAIPIALPDVDEVVLTGALAPAGPVAVARAHLAEALEGLPRREAGETWEHEGAQRQCALGHTLVERPPPRLVLALRDAPAGRHLVRLPPDRVLTRELSGC